MRNIYPTHLKIDVDGPELKVIKGAEIIFGRSELKEIFILLREFKVDKMPINSIYKVN